MIRLNPIILDERTQAAVDVITQKIRSLLNLVADLSEDEFSEQDAVELKNTIRRHVKLYNSKSLGLKKELLKNTNEKCAYCECKFRHNSPGDIEHVIPKSMRPDLALCINNLTIACSVCNNLKSDYHDEVYPLLNPHVDFPEKELIFLGATVIDNECTAKGKNTRRVLDLNRPRLVERRIKLINELKDLRDKLAAQKDPYCAKVCRDDINEMLSDAAEFSSMCRSAQKFFDWRAIDSNSPS